MRYSVQSAVLGLGAAVGTVFGTAPVGAQIELAQINLADTLVAVSCAVLAQQDGALCTDLTAALMDALVRQGARL